MNWGFLVFIGFAALALTQRTQIMDTVIAELPAFNQFDSLFEKYGVIHDVPWRWLKAICMNESSLGQDPLVSSGLVSQDGLSYGIMQLTVTTANDLKSGVTADDLNDPETSVDLSSKYVRQLMDMFGDDRRKTIMSYNQGPGNTKKGNEYAADYYDRFVRNLTKVLEKQPGDEMERG